MCLHYVVTDLSSISGVDRSGRHWPRVAAAEHRLSVGKTGTSSQPCKARASLKSLSRKCRVSQQMQNPLYY